MEVKADKSAEIEQWMLEYWDKDYRFTFYHVARLLAQREERGRLSGLEEAARAICPSCNDNDLEPSAWTDLYGGGWMHPIKPDRGQGHFSCFAGPIWKLRTLAHQGKPHDTNTQSLCHEESCPCYGAKHPEGFTCRCGTVCRCGHDKSVHDFPGNLIGQCTQCFCQSFVPRNQPKKGDDSTVYPTNDAG
jgi:hypothetical protein